MSTTCIARTKNGCSYADPMLPHKRTNASLIVNYLLRGQALRAERRRHEMNEDKGKEGEVEVDDKLNEKRGQQSSEGNPQGVKLTTPSNDTSEN